MKNKITLLASFLVFGAVVETTAQNTNSLYPGVTAIDRNYTANKVTIAPVIDGNPNDAAWVDAPWRQAAVTSNGAPEWDSPFGISNELEGSFSGVNDIDVKFKMVWDDGHYYILFRYKDDKIIYADNHTGYQAGFVPSRVTVNFNNLAAGDGVGSAYHAFRMDNLSYWLTPYSDALATPLLAQQNSYRRGINGLWHNFYPGQITESTATDSVLWAASHQPVSGAIQNHVGTVAGTYNATEKVYYIEFRDDKWSTLFNSVRTKLPGQKLYSDTVLPEQGDRFLLQGESNDADGTTNRRDYINHFTFLTGINAASANSEDLSQATIVTLGGTLSVNSLELKNRLKFYVDANNVLRLDESVDVEIYNVVGQKVLKSVNTSQVDITSLPKGVYIVKDKEGKSGKLIKE